MIVINLEAIGIFVCKSLITIMITAIVIMVTSALIMSATDNETAEKIAGISICVVLGSLFALAVGFMVCIVIALWSA